MTVCKPEFAIVRQRFPAYASGNSCKVSLSMPIHTIMEINTNENAVSTVDQNRVHLGGNRIVRGKRTYGRGAIIFGVPFVAAGVFIILIGTKTIKVDPGSVNAPYWVLTVIGAVFGLAGLWLMIAGLRGELSERRRARLQRENPDEPWLADHAWNTEQSVSSTGRKARGMFIAWVVMMAFLSPFHWWAFWSDDGNWIVISFVCLFDLALFAMLCNVVYLVMRQLKYGSSYVRFDRFPYRLGDTLDVMWGSKSGIGQYNKITFTLRCIEEVTETSGHGDNRNTKIVHYQLWSDKYAINEPGEHTPGLEVPVTFLLQEDAPPTALTGTPPHYWEIEVHADTPGVDFRADYLVPVYAPKSG